MEAGTAGLILHIFENNLNHWACSMLFSLNHREKDFRVVLLMREDPLLGLMKSYSDRLGKSARVLRLWAVLAPVFWAGAVLAQAPAPVPGNIVVQTNIPYLKGEPADEYAKTQCLLDTYLPKNPPKPYPLLVWFHGGALTGGAKSSSVSVQVAQSLAARGIGVVLVEYRLSPKAKFPAYVQDCAQGVRWAVEHAAALKAQPKVYVGGHSAGGYLAAILCADSRYLAEAEVKPAQVGGFISMSGQLMTHFTVAEERGFSPKVITADDAAPIHYIRKDMPPLLLLVGDRDWPARLEENQYFCAALKKVAEGTQVSLLVIPDRDHGGILKHSAEDNDPAAVAILGFVEKGILPPDGSAPVGRPGKSTLVDPTAQP
jgi:acetyl esterase/lipase